METHQSKADGVTPIRDILKKGNSPQNLTEKALNLLIIYAILEL
ncbi:MAG: hypothetical protein ACRCT1_18420 [Microcoleaceae cyanobacterium]